MNLFRLSGLKNTKHTLTTRKNLQGFWFVLPFILGLIFLYLPALINSIRYSFSDIIPNGVTLYLSKPNLDKYKQILFVDPSFVRGIVESLGSLILTTGIIIIYSLFIATVLNKDIKGKGILRAVLFLPVIISTGIISKVDAGNVLIGSSGTAAQYEAQTVAGGLFDTFDISSLIMSMNISPAFINIITDAIDGLYNIITRSGVQMLIFLAGIQGISRSVYESATIEGATWWESFWKITIPMISPLILVNLVYTIVDSFTNTGNVIMDKIFDTIMVQVDYSLASAMAILYFIVIGVLLAVIIPIASKLTFYETR